MNPALLADAAIKSTAVLLVAFVLTSFLRRNSAAVRHLVWTMAAALALLLPVGSILLPTYTIPLPRTWSAQPRPSHITPATTLVPSHPSGDDFAATPSPSRESRPVPGPPLPPSPPSLALSTLLPLLWLTGAACVSLYWLLGFAAVFRLCHTVPAVTTGPLHDLLLTTQSQLGLRRPVQLRVGPSVRMPITCRTLRPQLFLPASAEAWPADQLRSTLMHELAHAKRLDCAAQSLMNWACALYWFNPLVWFAAFHLRTERELACDDLVLNHGAAPTSYAEHLLAVARSFRAHPFPHPTALAMARPSGLRQRIADVLNAGVNRRMLSPRLVLTAALLTSTAFVCVSCIRFETYITPPAGTTATASPNSRVIYISAATQPTTMPTSTRAPRYASSAPAFPTLVTVLDDSTGQPIEGVEIVHDSIPKDGHVLTNSHGQAAIVFQGSMHPCMTLARTGYIGKLVRWYLQLPGSVQGDCPPTKYTVHLDPATSIGGKVVDDAGQPIAGANVEIYINGSVVHHGSEFVESPWTNRAVTTAADGTWHFDRVPPHAKSIKVAAWDYRHLDGGYFFLKEYAPQSALRDKTSVLTLPRGTPVTGTVVDPFYGHPVPNAKVSFGTDPTTSNLIPPLTTDAQGTFSLAAQPGTKLTLTISAPGYKPQVQQQLVNDQPATLECNLSPLHVQ